MKTGDVGRWSRGFTVASIVFLIAWQAAALAGAPRGVEVTLGLYGFVLHVVFGKAYTLVPSYFGRELASARGPAIHLPLSVVGTACLAVAPVAPSPFTFIPFEQIGAIAWATGVAIFLFTILSTIRGNLTGRETGTGDVNRHRERVDRISNAFVPVVLAYLLLSTYETLAGATGLPALVGEGPQTAHLLATGTAALLIFTIGFRLLPRFLVATPPTPLVLIVLPAGAIAPLLLAVDFWGGFWFQLGAVLQAIAVIGFALAYVVLFVRSERRRVGFYAVLLAVLSGVAGVALGLTFAFGTTATWAPLAHVRLNVLGFLGLTIVGVTYQFYPPAIGTFRGASDRTALASIALLAGGLAIQVAGFAAGASLIATAGEVSTLIGATTYGGLLLGVFYQRARRRDSKRTSQ